MWGFFIIALSTYKDFILDKLNQIICKFTDGSLKR